MLPPNPEGFQDHGRGVHHDEVLAKQPLRVGAAASLAELQADYAFFTPAILYLHGQFVDRPLIDFVRERPEVRLFYRKFQRPIFRGLEAPSNGNRDWNHVLFAVEREHWEAFDKVMGCLAFSYSEDGVLAAVGTQRFAIADPLHLDRSGFATSAAPLIEIAAYGLRGSRWTAAFERHGHPLMDLPALRFYPPDEKLRAAAEAFFRQDQSFVQAFQPPPLPGETP